MVHTLTHAYRSSAVIFLWGRKPQLASTETAGTRHSCHRTLGSGHVSYVGGVDNVPDIREKDDRNACARGVADPADQPLPCRLRYTWYGGLRPPSRVRGRESDGCFHHRKSIGDYGDGYGAHHEARLDYGSLGL